MEIREAIIQSIKKYFDDMEPQEYNKVVGARKRKYNKKYFDEQAKHYGLVDEEEMEDNPVEEAME